MLDEEINKTEADVMMLCNYGSYIQDSFSAWKLGLDRTSVSSCSRSINHLSLILKRNKHIFLQNVNIFIFKYAFHTLTCYSIVYQFKSEMWTPDFFKVNWHQCLWQTVH